MARQKKEQKTLVDVVVTKRFVAMEDFKACINNKRFDVKRGRLLKLCPYEANVLKTKIIEVHEGDSE